MYARGHSALHVQPTTDTPSALSAACKADAAASFYVMQADDELTFAVDDLECKCELNDRVRVGMNLPSRQRIVVKRRIGEDAETAVKRYRDERATAPRFAAAIKVLRASGAVSATPIDPVRRIIPPLARPNAPFFRLCILTVDCSHLPQVHPAAMAMILNLCKLMIQLKVRSIRPVHLTPRVHRAPCPFMRATGAFDFV